MSTDTSTPQPPSAPEAGTKQSAPRTAGQIIWARRRQRLTDGWREYRRNRPGLVGLVVLLAVGLIAVFAPLLVPHETLNVTMVTAGPNEPPSWSHPLGTGPDGRSVLGMLVWGARVSLLVGLAATFMSTVLGTIFGMIAGHFTGIVQAVSMRIIDFFLVIPALVLAITLSSVLGPSLFTIIVAIGVSSWAPTARLVRSQTLTVESLSYIERAWALGSGNAHIIGKHVLPAVMPLVLANTTLMVGSAIVAEATLAFLGLGDPSQISWGTMLKSALDTGAATAGYWWFLIPPGVAIVIVVLAFTLVGRAFESVINPTLRGR